MVKGGANLHHIGVIEHQPGLKGDTEVEGHIVVTVIADQAPQIHPVRWINLDGRGIEGALQVNVGLDQLHELGDLAILHLITAST